MMNLKMIMLNERSQIYTLEKENQPIVTANSLRRIAKWYKLTVGDGNILYVVVTVILKMYTYVKVYQTVHFS